MPQSFFDSTPGQAGLPSTFARDGQSGASSRWKRLRRLGRSGFADSTQQEVAWQRRRSASLRWAVAGGVLGALLGLVLFAPAAWLASAIASMTDGRVMLTDARGTIWRGDAVAVLTGGAESRSAAALPGRLAWTMRPGWMALHIEAQHDCCINGQARLRLEPGFSRSALTLLPSQSSQALGQWPAAWLSGLGTPWNTLQLGGLLSVHSQGFTMERIQGRVRFNGDIALDVSGASSRVSTLPVLGSYRLQLRADAASGGANLSMTTVQGPLMLQGQGQWAGNGLRFRGEARAAEGSEEPLNNLLNIIGRRQGAVSVIAIG